MASATWSEQPWVTSAEANASPAGVKTAEAGRSV